MLKVDLRHQRDAFELDARFETDAPVTGLVGPSGAGKSTLIHMIAGLERPAAGFIKADGRVLLDTARRIDVPAYRRRVGVVFQEHRLFPHMNVTRNLVYGLNSVPPPQRRWTLHQIVELLELGPFLGRDVSTLSGGERQRVAIGRTLLSAPLLLLMDEPLASLDHALKDQILPFLARVRAHAGIPILYVSHILEEVLRLTRDLVVMRAGRVEAQGPSTDLLLRGTLHAADRAGAVNLIPARVVEHLPADGLTRVRVDPGPDRSSGPPAHLLIPLAAAPAGSAVTLALRPGDVALAPRPVEGLSIQNQVVCTVRRVMVHQGRAMVELDLGAPLVAEVSPRSAHTLGLEAGRPVVCLVKSHAVTLVGRATSM